MHPAARAPNLALTKAQRPNGLWAQAASQLKSGVRFLIAAVFLTGAAAEMLSVYLLLSRGSCCNLQERHSRESQEDLT